MAKRKYEWNSKKIERYIKRGRGQKEGENHKPWLLAQDIPSTGRNGQRKGWKTGRDHHLLSDLESDYFYLLEWSSTVTDIREQFPLLPIEETVSIAEELGSKHSTDNKMKEILVMTTDFVINIGSKEIVRTLKYAGDLEDARTMLVTMVKSFITTVPNSPKIIRKYIQQDKLPSKNKVEKKPSKLDPYKPYVLQRIKESLPFCAILSDLIGQKLCI